MTTRETYIAKMKLQLDELNLQMDKLEAKAQEAREDVRDKYRAEMVKVHAQESSWDAMVAEAEKIRQAFVHSFSYFKSQV